MKSKSKKVIKVKKPFDINENALNGLYSHLFRLREDYIVSLTLPDDLTHHEAERLGKFFGSLSFFESDIEWEKTMYKSIIDNDDLFFDEDEEEDILADTPKYFGYDLNKDQFHNYPLRPEMTLTFTLPMDLKPSEGYRLEAYMPTLALKGFGY